MKLHWYLAIGAILAYSTYTPLPDGIAEPMKLRIEFVIRQISKAVGIGAVLLGFHDRASYMRSAIETRTMLRALGTSVNDEPNVTFHDEVFDGVRVRVYEPVKKSKDPIAGMVYIHGGGWVICSMESYHFQTIHMAARLGIVLISIDYRLSPEHPFPVPFQDSVKATVWFLQHAKSYNVDPNRIAVVGDSAGGNLAAATVALLTLGEKHKNMDLPTVKFQGLIYPALQSLDFKTPSYQQNDIFMLSHDIMVDFWSWYLTGNLKYASAMKVNNHTTPAVKRNEQRRLIGHDQIPDEFKQRGYKQLKDSNFGDVEVFTHIRSKLLDPSFAPLMRSDLAGLPPAYIMTCEFDVLRDDGILYAKKLEDAKVPVTWIHYKEGFHGMFSMFTGTLSPEVGKRAMDDFLQYAHENL